jgi:hypothetical protein
MPGSPPFRAKRKGRLKFSGRAKSQTVGKAKQINSEQVRSIFTLDRLFEKAIRRKSLISVSDYHSLTFWTWITSEIFGCIMRGCPNGRLGAIQLSYILVQILCAFPASIMSRSTRSDEFYESNCDHLHPPRNCVA